MARKANQDTKWNFEATTVKLMKPNGEWSGLFANMRTDTGEVFNDAVTEQYGLIQNRELMDAARLALAKRGMTDYQEEIIVADGGARMYATFTFKNRNLANSVGDVFGYKLILKNSFDRSLRQSFELGFLRLVCLNGMGTMEKEFSATKKHCKGATMDFLGDALEAAMKSGPHALETYDNLARKAISDKQGQNILLNFEDKGILSGVVRESVETLWLNPRRKEDENRNMYNLYNAVTDHLTHHVQAERFEYAQKTNTNVLIALANAVRKPENFAKLIAPIQSNKVMVVASGPIINV